MEKKVRKAIKYENLTPELLKEISKKYPNGFEEHLIKVNGPSNTFFYGFMLDLPEACYLIKVNVKIDNSYEDESEDFDNEGSIGREDDNFANSDNESDEDEKVKPNKPIDDNDDDDEDDDKLDAEEDVEIDDEDDEIDDEDDEIEEDEEESSKVKIKSKPDVNNSKKKNTPKKSKK